MCPSQPTQTHTHTCTHCMHRVKRDMNVGFHWTTLSMFIYVRGSSNEWYAIILRKVTKFLFCGNIRFDKTFCVWFQKPIHVRAIPATMVAAVIATDFYTRVHVHLNLLATIVKWVSSVCQLVMRNQYFHSITQIPR